MNNRREVIKGGLGLAAIIVSGKAPAVIVRSMIASRNGFAPIEEDVPKKIIFDVNCSTTGKFNTAASRLASSAGYGYGAIVWESEIRRYNLNMMTMVGPYMTTADLPRYRNGTISKVPVNDAYDADVRIGDEYAFYSFISKNACAKLTFDVNCTNVSQFQSAAERLASESGLNGYGAIIWASQSMRNFLPMMTAFGPKIKLSKIPRYRYGSIASADTTSAYDADVRIGDEYLYVPVPTNWN